MPPHLQPLNDARKTRPPPKPLHPLPTPAPPRTHVRIPPHCTTTQLDPLHPHIRPMHLLLLLLHLKQRYIRLPLHPGLYQPHPHHHRLHPPPPKNVQGRYVVHRTPSAGVVVTLHLPRQGVGTRAYIPHPPAAYVFSRQLHPCPNPLGYILFDAALIHIQQNPCYRTGGPSLVAFRWGWRTTAWVFIVSIYCSMSNLYAALSIVAVATGLYEPRNCPTRCLHGSKLLGLRSFQHPAF